MSFSPGSSKEQTYFDLIEHYQKTNKDYTSPLLSTMTVVTRAAKAWFPLVLRIVRIGDFYDIPMTGILTTSGNTSSQKSQTVGNFYDVIGRIGIISTLKVLSQTSQTSANFTMSVNLAVLRIAIVVRIPV